MSQEIGIWWSVTRSILQSSYRETFDELEVEGFLRERLTEMQAIGELVIKKQEVHWHSRQMYQKEVFEDMETMAMQLKHSLFQVLVNQDLQKIGKN